MLARQNLQMAVRTEDNTKPVENLMITSPVIKRTSGRPKGTTKQVVIQKSFDIQQRSNQERLFLTRQHIKRSSLKTLLYKKTRVKKPFTGFESFLLSYSEIISDSSNFLFDWYLIVSLIDTFLQESRG